jgi:hypothetical protein
MMAKANPESWDNLIWEDRLIQDHQPKIKDCRIEATKKKVSSTTVAFLV